jgi:hypothetical protein
MAIHRPPGPLGDRSLDNSGSELEDRLELGPL